MRQVLKIKSPPIMKPKKIGDFSERILKEENGWLSRNGDFNMCAYGNHEDVAEELVNFYKYIEPKLSTDSQIVEKHGWIKIQKKTAYSPDHVKYNDEWFVTKEQFNFLNSYYDYHGHESIYHMNMRIK